MVAILEVANVSVTFGGVSALAGVNFHVPKGEITALIGPNGAGKTTCFNVISGLKVANSGSVTFKGEEIGSRPAYQRRGMGRTFQVVQLFDGLTVRDSIMVGAHRLGAGGLLSNGVFSPTARRANRAVEDRADAVIEKLGLERWSESLAVALPLGLQRLVELGRALATEPELLMLDESASGLSPSESGNLESLVRALAEEELSILLVEHNIRFVNRLAAHLVVLNFGKVIFEGESRTGLTDPGVVAAYLGGTKIDA